VTVQIEQTEWSNRIRQPHKSNKTFCPAVCHLFYRPAEVTKGRINTLP